MSRPRLLAVAASIIWLLLANPPAHGQKLEWVAGAPVKLGANDYTPKGLRKAEKAVPQHYRRGYRDLPLDVKAEFFEWQLWRYHRTPWRQIHHCSKLPQAQGATPQWYPGSDSSTWNGALLAALSHKYAVTKDRRTLERIGELLRGLHLFFTVTRKPGLAARWVNDHNRIKPDKCEQYVKADGTLLYFRGDPAKGGYNQLAGGLAAVMMYVAKDLPLDIRTMVQDDLTAMVLHVINHDYRLTMRDGQRTPFGNVTPVVGSIGVPFNAQVAYEIVALGHCFPPNEPALKGRIDRAYRYLRDEHHAYWEDPLRHWLVQPQRVGASPFVKGMNDRNHVTNAAFVGLVLERYQAPREGRGPFDPRFVNQLGQTMLYSMNFMEQHHNALCNFMWAAMLKDPQVFDALIQSEKSTQRAKMEGMLVNGVEQLRRFKLDRFKYPGPEIETSQTQWVDARPASDYQWKEPHNVAKKVTGPALDYVVCGTDYLYAYWLFRYYRLDRHPLVLKQHGPVVGPPARRGPSGQSSRSRGLW